MPDTSKPSPAYRVASVDHALQLAVMLQREGPLTVSAAAQRLGVARSTAHRLLSMLVYRDFAEQDADRAYRAGPVLAMAAQAHADLDGLRAAALGPLLRLVDTLDETASLSVRAGTSCRFLLSVEGTQALRAASREGQVLPAHETAGGLIGLAALSDDQVRSLYPAGRPGGSRPGSRPDLTRLLTDLAAIRRTGAAVNLERSERGLAAVGVPVHGPAGRTVGAVSLSIPTARYQPEQVGQLVTALEAAAKAVAQALPRPHSRPILV